MEKEKKFPIYVKIQDIPKILKEAGINISYRGMRHYINLGIFPRPTKMRGHKEKYYEPHIIAALFFIVKHMGGFFCLNHNEIKKIFGSQGGLAFMMMGGMPIEFIMTYSKIMEKYQERWLKDMAPNPMAESTHSQLPFSLAMSVSLERALSLYSKILLEEAEIVEKDNIEMLRLRRVVNARFKSEFIKYMDSYYRRMVRIYSMEYLDKLGHLYNHR